MNDTVAATRYDEKAVTARLGPSPVHAALGFQFTPEENGLRVELPWSRRIVCSADDGSVDRGAILTVVDHALGQAVTAAGHTVIPSTTIDLRVDWMRSLNASPVVMHIQVVQRAARTALAKALIWQISESEPCAVAIGQFMVGVVPGGSALGAVDEIEDPVTPPGSDHFASYAGMTEHPGQSLRVRGSPHIAGMASVGAFHGGIIAAACERASRLALGDWAASGARCASIEIEYMRPSFVVEDLLVSTETVRRGRRTAVIDATARQGDERGATLTRARSVWLRPAA